MIQLKNHPTYDLVPDASAHEIVYPVMRHRPGIAEFNTLVMHWPAAILETEDFAYHHGSAVTLPCLPSCPEAHTATPQHWEERTVTQPAARSHPQTDARFRNEEAPAPDDWPTLCRRRALVILAVTYRFLEKNPDYRLLIAGHADTSGDDAANFRISDQRADTLLSLLRGDKDLWTRTCLARSKVEDRQQILKHYAAVNLWNCDPGAVDDQDGPRTRSALSAFQSSYNAQFKKSIAVDGIAGRETWEAFFDVYMDELARLLNVEVSELGSLRKHLRFVDDQTPRVGCGERVPIEEPKRNNYRSRTNRRVELLFFHKSRLPDLTPHREGGSFRSGSAGREASPIYAENAYRFEVVRPIWWETLPPESTYEPRFAIEADDAPLGELHDDPSSANYDTNHPVAETPAPGASPWDFLDHFYDYYPQRGRNNRNRGTRGPSP